jgi:hypothetical protein
MIGRVPIVDEVTLKLPYEVMPEGIIPGSVSRNKRVITGTYTLAQIDISSTVLHVTANNPVTITLPAGLTQEVEIPWRQFGTGQITFVAGSGMNIASTGSLVKSSGQYSTGTVTLVSATTWLLKGNLSV